MIAIDNTLVSEDLFDRQFVCNLSKCQGACCVEGDKGAPLEREEIDIIAGLLPSIRPFMTEAFYEDLAEQGFYEQDYDGEYVTTCQPTGECNFVVYDNGIAGCSIEKAYKAGAIDFYKPVSCHLYPVRVKKYKQFLAVNYDRWHICAPACTLGAELNVPIYRFVKEALLRKFGEAWFNELAATADFLEGKQD